MAQTQNVMNGTCDFKKVIASEIERLFRPFLVRTISESTDFTRIRVWISPQMESEKVCRKIKRHFKIDNSEMLVCSVFVYADKIVISCCYGPGLEVLMSDPASIDKVLTWLMKSELIYKRSYK